MMPTITDSVTQEDVKVLTCPSCKSNLTIIYQASSEPPFMWNDQEYFQVKCRCGLGGPRSLSKIGAINSWNSHTWVEREKRGEKMTRKIVQIAAIPASENLK